MPPFPVGPTGRGDLGNIGQVDIATEHAGSGNFYIADHTRGRDVCNGWGEVHAGYQIELAAVPATTGGVQADDLTGKHINVSGGD